MRPLHVHRFLPLALAACATAGAAESVTASKAVTQVETTELVRPHGIPGETIEYELALRGFPIGRAVVAVGEPGWFQGRRALIVRARGQSAGLAAVLGEMTWDQTTMLDMTTGHVIQSREETNVMIAGNRRHRVREIGDERAHDVISAVGVVRGWRSQPGNRAELAVRFGHATIDAELVDEGRQDLAGADRPTVRYRGTVEDKLPFTAWISDDVARVPLRFESATPLGAVTVELVDYRAPRG